MADARNCATGRCTIALVSYRDLTGQAQGAGRTQLVRRPIARAWLVAQRACDADRYPRLFACRCRLVRICAASTHVHAAAVQAASSNDAPALLSEQLRTAIYQLPDDERIVLLLVNVERFTREQAANILGISLEVVSRPTKWTPNSWRGASEQIPREPLVPAANALGASS